jgi:GGDEF domain-containing protein
MQEGRQRTMDRKGAPTLIDDPPRPDDDVAIEAAQTDWFDPSTGVPGPAFWQAVLGAESARCARYKRTSTVVLAEAVGFADLVQVWGREVTRQGVIDAIAVLRSGCRTSDYVALIADGRVGMILTETDEVAAINMIERVRDRCDRALRARAAGGRIAFGWASPRGSLSLRDAIVRAEELLRRDAATG